MESGSNKVTILGLELHLSPSLFSEIKSIMYILSLHIIHISINFVILHLLYIYFIYNKFYDIYIYIYIIN